MAGMDDLVTRGMVIAMFDERLAGMGTDVGKLITNLNERQGGGQADL